MSEDKHTYKYKLYYTTLLPQHLFVPPQILPQHLFSHFVACPYLFFLSLLLGLVCLPSGAPALTPSSPVLLPDGELDGACTPCLLAVDTHRLSCSPLCPAHTGSMKPSSAGVKLSHLFPGSRTRRWLRTPSPHCPCSACQPLLVGLGPFGC